MGSREGNRLASYAVHTVICSSISCFSKFCIFSHGLVLDYLLCVDGSTGLANSLHVHAKRESLFVAVEMASPWT